MAATLIRLATLKKQKYLQGTRASWLTASTQPHGRVKSLPNTARRLGAGSPGISDSMTEAT
jgi:hypothetical protein